MEITKEFLESYYKSIDLTRKHGLEEIITGKMVVGEDTPRLVIQHAGQPDPWLPPHLLAGQLYRSMGRSPSGMVMQVLVWFYFGGMVRSSLLLIELFFIAIRLLRLAYMH